MGYRNIINGAKNSVFYDFLLKKILFDIATQKVLEDFPPMPQNIKIAYFCEYLQEVDLKNSKTIPTIVEIKHLYINDEIISDKDSYPKQFAKTRFTPILYIVNSKDECIEHKFVGYSTRSEFLEVLK